MISQPRSRASAFIPINGPALRELRKDRGLSVKQLAEQVGVGSPYISNLELGNALRCSPPVHAALVRALNPENAHALRSDKIAAS